MILYFAEPVLHSSEITFAYKGNFLISYYYLIKNKRLYEFFAKNIYPKLEKEPTYFFLDSGAHSANTIGAPISLDKYITFIKAHPAIKIYCGLDDIQDSEITIRNQRIMEEAGLNPIITFHYGEDLSILEKYCKEFSYIALGGVVGKSRKLKMRWLANCWAVIKNYKSVKVHMFGVHDFEILSIFPFYSADASSHSMAAALGTSQHGHYKTIAGAKPKTMGQVNVLMNEMKQITPTEKTKFRVASFVEERLRQQDILTRLWQKRGINWD